MLPGSTIRTRAESPVGEEGIHRGFALHERRDVLTERRAHFEAMSGAAADEPHILELRMLVDEVVAVARRLVLTHPRFHERRVGESREALRHDFLRAREAVR